MNLSLAPVIQSIEVCRDEQDRPRHLRLRGSNLSCDQAARAIVDGACCPGMKPVSEDGPDAAETLVSIPDPRMFAYNRTHSIIFTTAHGIAIKKF